MCTLVKQGGKSLKTADKRANEQRTAQYSGIVHFNLKSRLLPPTESVYVPMERTHDLLETSQIDRSYLESVMNVRVDSPGCSSTSVNPRKTDGGSPACAGKCK